MTIIWITLAIAFLSGSFARRYNNPITTNGVTLSNPNKFFAFIAMAVLVLVSGLRNNIGDTGNYIYSFNNLVHNNIFNILEDFSSYRNDSGFDVFQSLIKSFISTDPQVFLFICALITNVCIIRVLYKYSPAFELSLFLYITTGAYFVTMNGIRQCLVAALLFLCIKLITDGKWLPFFIIVLVLSTIHSSAMIFIPVYFFVRLKPWSKVIGITLLASMIILLLFDSIGSFLLGILAGTQYGHYEKYILTEGAGANVVRVFVAAVPLVLAYLGKTNIEVNNNKLIGIVINFSVLNLVFYILAVQNWIFARLCIYFGLYSLLLLPWLIKKVFDDKKGTIIYGSSLILYVIYYYYEMESYLRYWGIGYISNYIGF
ncbi:Transmembrane protein EpsG [Sporomusa ovata DSM 2662]|uniref:Capsular polysaccharide biosynthesis protein n=1 Tax=Sporomusa ovata TaxID=2378 RepID=A0A0U1L777_9FIRM|nr:EpsG family protein [Sporomusa ovata]EQB28390.1 transmembrane protein EpsG [Sporomusa ovata DSM 2662]CQR74714.1 capsular polysaccharide biosynthesis protein [Sporomusa ovata]